MVRPVAAEYRTSQGFGSMKTAGVRADPDPASGAGYYVHLYGNYQPDGHAGCDIACPEGTPVYAIAAGTVLWADWGTKLPGDDTSAGYRRRWFLYKGFPGIVTVIQHAGWIGVYAHLSAAHLNPGDVVSEGMLIGLSGGTGGVAPHLHVEALIDLTYRTGGGLIYGRTNPEPYFGGLAAMGSTTPASEEDDLNQDQDRALAAVYKAVNPAPAAGQLASQGDINIVLARMKALEDTVLAALGKPQQEPSAVLVKGDKESTVYAWDGGTGYRALDYNEFAALMATGAELRTVDQATINGGK